MPLPAACESTGLPYSTMTSTKAMAHTCTRHPPLQRVEDRPHTGARLQRQRGTDAGADLHCQARSPVGLTVVTGSLETAQELDLLRKIDCTQIQGFLIFHAISSDQFQPLLSHDGPTNAYGLASGCRGPSLAIEVTVSNGSLITATQVL